MRAGDLRGYRLKDLEQLTFGLLYSEDRTALGPLLDRVRAAMPGRRDLTDGRALVYLTCHLAKAGVYHLPAIQDILEQANLVDMTELYTDGGQAAAVDLFSRLEEPQRADKETSQAAVNRSALRNETRNRNALFQVLELDFIRELFGLETASVLDPEKRRLLVKYFHRDESDTAKLETRDTFNSKLMDDIQRDLVLINPKLDGSRVYYGYPLPCSTSKCLIVKRGEGLVQLSSDLFYQVPNKNDFVIIYAPKRNQLGADGELFGRCKDELMYLRTLGFPTRLVNCFKYYSAKKDRRNLNYIRAILTSES